MISLSRIVSASRLFALRTSVFAHTGPGGPRRGAAGAASRPGRGDRSRACRVPVRGSRKRGTAAPQVPGPGDVRTRLTLHWNNGTPGGRLATLDTPAKTISDTRDSSLLAASYPNYIDPISLHISSLSRDRRRGLCGPTPGLFERRGLCGPAELAAEGGCGEAARSRRGPDSIAPAAQIRSITVTTRGVVLILAARSKRGLEVVLMKPHVRSELATRNHS
jgi:hypothetical protein